MIKKIKKYKKLAQTITFASTHVVVGSITILYLIYTFSSTFEDFVKTSLIVLMIAIIIPSLYIIYLLKKGKIQNYHMKDRKERILPFIIIFISGSLSLLTINYLEVSSEIIRLGTTFLLISAGYVAITFKYKISGHGFVFTSSVLFLSFFANYQLLLLLIFLVPIGWSRVYLEEHTLGEFIGGTTYAIASFILFSILLSS